MIQLGTGSILKGRHQCILVACSMSGTAGGEIEKKYYVEAKGANEYLLNRINGSSPINLGELFYIETPWNQPSYVAFTPLTVNIEDKPYFPVMLSTLPNLIAFIEDKKIKNIGITNLGFRDIEFQEMYESLKAQFSGLSCDITVYP